MLLKKLLFFAPLYKCRGRCYNQNTAVYITQKEGFYYES